MSDSAARDGELIRSRSGEQDWIVSWHPPPTVPEGTSHGAAGVCVTDNDQLVLISHDGKRFGFPAGRPNGDESPEETLRREVLEEACAIVLVPRLLGFVRSECVNGWQLGLVLVRSYWLAEVEVAPWEPKFEIRERRVAPVADALHHLADWLEQDPDRALRRTSYRALYEAGLWCET